MLDALDLAFIGIGNCAIGTSLRPGGNYPPTNNLTRSANWVLSSEVCLRFLDAQGNPVPNPLDELVVGVTTAQLRSARRRWAVAGGSSKYPAIRAGQLGGWVDVLVTDTVTATYLASSASEQSHGTQSGRLQRPGKSETQNREDPQVEA